MSDGLEIYHRTMHQDGPTTRAVFSIACGKCGVVSTATADIKAPRNGGTARASHLSKKFTNSGWDVGERPDKHRCPGCKNKVISMAQIAEKLEKPKAEAPRMPSREDKRKIMRLLEDHYDEARGRYIESYSDEVLAKTAGVPRKWIEDLRIEFFGDSGSSDEAMAVLADISKARSDLDALQKLFADEVVAIRQQISKIEKRVAA